MNIGTKSLLYGAHQFLLHPFFLAVAWTKLYGLPLDPRLWVAFIVHDWGYWGLDNMDGETGQRHPELGGRIMAFLFGKKWGDFTRCHSRFYARILGVEPSKLCAADKYVLFTTPAWIYLRCVQWTGEVKEYMGLLKRHDPEYTEGDVLAWYLRLREIWWKEVLRLHSTS
jgi:hypothetical protein